MDQALIFDKRVGPIKHVGGIFSKTLINEQLASVSKSTKNYYLKFKVGIKDWEITI